MPRNPKNNANLGNFRDLTVDERRKLASKAGKRSAEVRAGKARISALLAEAMNDPVQVNGKTVTAAEALVMKLKRMALVDGNLKAIELILDRTEGKALQKLDMSSSDGSMSPAPSAVSFDQWKKTQEGK